MSNQQVIDFIRAELAEKTPLDEICELLMDRCLAPDSEVGGLGCDNMSVIIVGILHGKSLEEWYDWMAERVAADIPKKDALGNDVVDEIEEAAHEDSQEKSVNNVDDQAPILDNNTRPSTDDEKDWNETKTKGKNGKAKNNDRVHSLRA